MVKLSNPRPITPAGAGLTLRVGIANEGSAPVGASKLGVYLARGGKHGKRDRLLKTVRVRPLAVGASARLKTRVRLPRSAAGRFRLIACADSKRRVRESTEADNCRAGRAFQVAGAAPPPTSPPRPAPAPAPAAAPAFTTTDQVDWGKTDDTSEQSVAAGSPIVATMRAANGLPGQAGYTSSQTPPQPLATGTVLTLHFTNGDDGAVPVSLPFAFPFGGIAESTASVGVNGWLGFGSSPALDYYTHSQPGDYRGLDGAVGEFYRGLMPFWDDLSIDDQSHGPGAIREVVPADGSYVAFQWEVSRLAAAAPLRTFQVVLFPDGRFRFDYPGANEAGGYESFIGYSLGTGAASADVIAATAADVPATSLLFTPSPLAGAGALAAAIGTLALPRDSTFLAAPGCTLVQAPTSLAAGSVSCPFPSLAAGEQQERSVEFALPANAPGESNPENAKYAGAFQAGGFSLGDRDEVPILSNYLEPTAVKVEPSYLSPASPVSGFPATFLVKVGASPASGLDEPALTLALPANATLESVQIEGDDVPCDPVAEGAVTCLLPSGVGAANVTVTVTPLGAGPMTLAATLRTLNGGTASGEATSPAVGA